ncbi:preprotein translocase subunit YajC [Guggenheimella bovis]
MPYLSAAPAQGGFSYYTIILWVGLLAIFYFLLIRPQKKRQEQAKEMQNQLATGDKVTTIGGIMGVVSAVSEDNITIDVNGSKLTFKKWAIGSVESAEQTTVE